MCIQCLNQFSYKSLTKKLALSHYFKMAILKELWVLWFGLAKHTQNVGIALWELFMFICIQKINFINVVFPKILQKYYQLPILGTLDMSDHFHQKQYPQLAETLMFICM